MSWIAKDSAQISAETLIPAALLMPGAQKRWFASQARSLAFLAIPLGFL
jgi:hypothetical protein